MDEIVRRLRSNSASRLKYLKESLPVKGLREKDGEDEEEEELTAPEEDNTEEPDFSSDTDISGEDSEFSDEEGSEEDDEVLTPDDELEVEDKSEENVNPLDNEYAVNYSLGQEVALTYSNGAKTKLRGTIDGYDSEGFYRIKWANGMTTNGITDIALADMINEVTERKCICGGTKFVDEDNQVVCDSCGRALGESKDPLALADKSRPKGKKLIRSEAHPVSTTIQDSIRNAFKKKVKINEESEEGTVFSRLRSKLEGEFWTRLPELVEDIEALGYEVLDYNSEYVVIAWEDEEGDQGELQIYIGGTSRTMTLDFNRVRFMADMDIE